MVQLVQLQKNASTEFEAHDIKVLVVFREEKDGQKGLQKVVAATSTKFDLALDPGATETTLYSPGKQDHGSYIIGSTGVILAILEGTTSDRAQPEEFIAALDEL